MPDIAALLAGAAKTLSTTVTAQGTGQIVGAGVGPLPGDLDVTEILTGTIDLTWLTKSVGFKDALPEPVVDATTLVNKIKGGVLVSSIAGGIEGLLGQLKGTIPLLNKTRVAVGLDVTWKVLDKDKNELGTGEFSVLTGAQTGAIVKGTNILLAFKPKIVEITKTTPIPEPELRFLRPQVTLTALDQAYTLPDLPDIPVLVPAIGVPKLLAAFRHSDFRPTHNGEDGFVLLFVPEDSPLQSLDHLKETLAHIQRAVTAVKSFTDILTILPGVDTLLGGVTASPYFVFVAAKEIANLNDITAIQRAWYENDIELEDEISSMILIGPAGAVLDVYCETDFNDENGHFTVKIGPNNFTTVPSTHAKTPKAHPEGTLEVLKPAHHDVDSQDHFGDWISALKWL